MAVDMALVRTVYFQQRCELRKQASLVASSAAQWRKKKFGHFSLWVNTASVKNFRLRRQRGARPFSGFGNVEALIRDVTQGVGGFARQNAGMYHR